MANIVERLEDFENRLAKFEVELEELEKTLLSPEFIEKIVEKIVVNVERKIKS